MNLRKGLLLIFLLTMCTSRTDETKLKELLTTFDRLLIDNEFNYKQTIDNLRQIEKELINSKTEEYNNEDWQTFINRKWNTDSTLTMISSNKKFKKGFKREIIINSDRGLFIYRFSTIPMTSDSIDNKDYSFIETFDYSTKERPLRYLTRVDWRKQVLSDTIEFRIKPFSDFTKTVQNHYDNEMDYCENILFTN